MLTALFRWLARMLFARQPTLVDHLTQHFQPTSLDELRIAERQFPFHVRADLQRAIGGLFATGTEIRHFCGVRKEYEHLEYSLSDCLSPNLYDRIRPSPPQYEEVDIGEERAISCLKNGLWLLERTGQRFAVLLSRSGRCGEVTSMKFEIAVVNSSAGSAIIEAFFQHLENAVLKADCYRGKILSLEQEERSYSGEGQGIVVHKLELVERDQVILPTATIEMLDRNVIDFARYRERLRKLQLSTKKGILFHGPPGTGKTHTIHYLTRALPGHTTFIITAEQVGLLGEYMTLARLLQPSIVVIEDVDLIARDRVTMQSACEEVLLNKLLNEMDGLKESADILFILTTNRPAMLEDALAARPGRIDQAIEFPLPDDDGRTKLVRLYARGLRLSDDTVTEISRRTDGVSAAFIKELMRRAAQYQFERNGESECTVADILCALDEMLVRGGRLNRTILGASAPSSA